MTLPCSNRVTPFALVADQVAVLLAWRTNGLIIPIAAGKQCATSAQCPHWLQGFISAPGRYGGSREGAKRTVESLESQRTLRAI